MRRRGIEDVPSSVKTTGFPGLFPICARRERELWKRRCASRHSRAWKESICTGTVDQAPRQAKENKEEQEAEEDGRNCGIAVR